MDPKSNPILPTYDAPPNAKNYMGTKFYNKLREESL
jgi:hypothetical protein